MSRNIELKDKILDITEGVCENLVDMSLMFLFFGIELGFKPKSSQSVYRAGKAAEKTLLGLNYQIIKRSIYLAREKGWIRPGELKITEEGRRRIQGRLPKNAENKLWDGKWHIALFDVPEKQRSKRDALRQFLRRLGFGKLFESTWISPYNFLGEASEFIKSSDLDPYVILSISDRVGVKGSRELADRVWNMGELNNDYKNFLHSKETSPARKIFQYLSITRRDPRLPGELLPIDWKGRRAFDSYQELTKINFKNIST